MLASTAGAAAQGGARATALKAEAVIGFVKLTDWPATAPGSPITLCVSGDVELTSALEAAAYRQPHNVRPIVVQLLPADDPVGGCHAVFASVRDPQRSLALVEESAPFPVLTMGDTARFAETGGMVELLFERGLVHFAVNVDAVQRARLRVSSRVLGLSAIVRDSHER